jgi:FkbM family methyltransferase
VAGTLGYLRSVQDRLSGRAEQRLNEILLEREQTIRQREDVTRERETEIARLQTLIDEIERQRDETIRQREDVTRERETEIARLHALVNEIVKERDEAVAQSNAKLDSLHRQEARLIAQEQKGPLVTHTRGFNVVDVERQRSVAVFDAAEVFRKWSAETERLSGLSLRGAQKLIDPYIVERSVHGFRYRMIIATEEGRSWYDNLQGIEAHQAQSLGLIWPGDTVLDCGCNQGFNAMIYSSLVGPSGKVVGFDPYPLNVAIGRFNAALNHRSNIEFVEAGISDKHATSVASTSEQCIALNDQIAPDLTTIKLVPLDDYASMKPDYVKIDIEGAEVDALAGASEIIAQMPSFYIEIHPDFLPRFGKRPMDIFDYINLDKYKCFINYPDMAGLSIYEIEFEISRPCAIFLVPRHRPPIIRYYPL